MWISEQTIQIGLQDRNRHIAFAFDIPCDMRRLRVRTTYTPKYGTDTDRMRVWTRQALRAAYPDTEPDDAQADAYLPLTNHIAWSIDSPSGALGTEHRANPDQEHTVTPQWASSGFRPAPITAGRWVVTATINSVVTDRVTVTVRIEAE